MTEKFLSRWSRRKREEAGDEPAEAVPQPAETAAAEDEEISPEEIAALPAVEDLVATSDIAGFLRKGVPLALRNAALRRIWALDPEVRDFVGHARDYAWDWNTPGGVPVSGPLAEGTDVQAMVKRVFSERDAGAAEPPRESPPARENVTSAPATPPDVAEARAPTIEPTETEIEKGAESTDTPGEPSAPPPPKRHGSALPI